MPDWLEVSFRTLVTVMVLFIFTKALGRRQVSQLSMFEYITGITVGSIAAYISLELDSGWHLGIVSLFVWGLVSYTLELLTLKSNAVRSFTEGSPLVVIENGNILEKNLKRAKYSGTDLMQQLRIKNIFATEQVEYAILEKNGHLSVYLKKQYQPLTLSTLGIKASTGPPPQTVVLEGKISHAGLNAADQTLDWLQKELKKRKIALEEIFMAQVDGNGKLNVDLNDITRH